MFPHVSVVDVVDVAAIPEVRLEVLGAVILLFVLEHPENELEECDVLFH